ncbi:MAG: ArsC/Spx/MgsR family protein [Candidatus Marinarcus sp.]|uniref:ArsC/Spx/MgsR family protein n=1 Tax=Candidatus Marinarcus sp. TaxID=3100987 RepID=UPI003B0026D4
MFYKKKEVVFYEKPGCSGNARQKALLKVCGVEFSVKSILDTPWSKEELESFFDGLSVPEIFNLTAPKVKDKSIDIHTISKDEAIKLMLDEPLLIKRPLLQIDDVKVCGFDIDRINQLLNINMDKPHDINECTSSVPCKSV